MRKKFRLLFLILILTFNLYGCGEKTIDTSPINNTGKTFIDSNLSNNFILSYKVETDGLKVNFIIDITPKNNTIFNKTIAIAYIDDCIMDFISSNTYSTIGNFDDPIDMDINMSNNSSSKGLSIARSITFKEDTDIDKLVPYLEKGINVAISWKGGEEFLHVKDVEIIIK